MRIKIAEIRLAPGQVGFYDELTNIHLTLSRPFATVYQGMNTSRLQQSVNSGRLILVQGSLKPEPFTLAVEPEVASAKVEPVKQVKIAAEPKVVKAPEVIQEPVEEVVVEQEPAIATLSLEPEEAPAVVEEVAAEEVVETKSKKKTSKK